jgi:hypothetical protein
MPDFPANFPPSENERIPHAYQGSFSYLPPNAFATNFTRRILQIKWEDRLSTLKEILGYATFDDAADPPRDHALAAVERL